MKPSHQSMIYSAFVFPGAGYFVSGPKWLGYGFIAASIAALLPLMKEAHFKAQIIAQKIVYAEIPLNVLAIKEQIDLTPGILTEQQITICYSILAGLWLFGLIDSARRARRLR
ncbi:hypothetical protein [Bermanella sp. R86510]|uniref:hypothetical protein n=1 Tax=unclassified Bermanella TaxID=2627862 RepID=UPI0037CCAB14